jgi:hypothetical protein
MRTETDILWCLFPQLNTEWAQVEVIDLINDGSGLGFGIIGGRSTGVVVKTILPGGVADRVSTSYCGPQQLETFQERTFRMIKDDTRHHIHSTLISHYAVRESLKSDHIFIGVGS